MKKRKAKKIAIHAELRKESQTFNGYLKYEITVKNPDGQLKKYQLMVKDYKMLYQELYMTKELNILKQR